MSVFNKAIKTTLANLPSMVLHRFLDKKLKAAGIVMPKDVLTAFASHIVENKEGSFLWDDGADDGEKERSVSLSFTPEDVKEIEDELARVMEEMPRIVESTTKSISKKIFRSLVRKWEIEHAAQLFELDQFRARLEDRWGEGLGYLRMLLTSCREMGYEASLRFRRSRSRKSIYRRWVLGRLHIRACQVSDEVICLIENGFSDGAMARWRTLHEISVVASLIAKGDEDLAERYILHDAIEVMRQANEHEESQVTLGAKPIGKRERRRIDAHYAAAIARFGPAFAHPYGWASKHLNLKKPTFKELQMASGRGGSGSYYKLASFNIHAGARSLFFNLSSVGDEFVPNAGRSNAGLTEPGELTAYALTSITSLYVDSGPNLDRILMLNSLLEIRDAVSPALRKAERQLMKDELALRAERAAQVRTRSAKRRKDDAGVLA